MIRKIWNGLAGTGAFKKVKMLTTQRSKWCLKTSTEQCLFCLQSQISSMALYLPKLISLGKSHKMPDLRCIHLSYRLHTNYGTESFHWLKQISRSHWHQKFFQIRTTQLSKLWFIFIRWSLSCTSNWTRHVDSKMFRKTSTTVPMHVPWASSFTAETNPTKSLVKFSQFFVASVSLKLNLKMTILLGTSWAWKASLAQPYQ